jgi:hypothetical protein
MSFSIQPIRIDGALADRMIDVFGIIQDAHAASIVFIMNDEQNSKQQVLCPRL